MRSQGELKLAYEETMIPRVIDIYPFISYASVVISLSLHIFLLYGIDLGLATLFGSKLILAYYSVIYNGRANLF